MVLDLVIMGMSLWFTDARYLDLDAPSHSMADQVASAVDTKGQQCRSLGQACWAQSVSFFVRTMRKC